MTTWHCHAVPQSATAPVGQPQPSVEITLCDEEGRSALEGEVMFGGIMFRCYLNMPELTAQKFRQAGEVLKVSGVSRHTLARWTAEPPSRVAILGNGMARSWKSAGALTTRQPVSRIRQTEVSMISLLKPWRTRYCKNSHCVKCLAVILNHCRSQVCGGLGATASGLKVTRMHPTCLGKMHPGGAFPVKAGPALGAPEAASELPKAVWAHSRACILVSTHLRLRIPILQ